MKRRVKAYLARYVYRSSSRWRRARGGRPRIHKRLLHGLSARTVRNQVKRYSRRMKLLSLRLA